MQSTITKVHRVTPDLIQLTRYCHVSTMRNVTQNTTPVRKLAPLTTRSSSLRCVSAADHHTAEQYTTKRLGQNLERISQEEINHGIHAMASSRQQDTKQLLRKPGEDASQGSSWNQMSLPIYQGHQNFQHSSCQQLGATQDALCEFVRDLETMTISICQ